MSHDFLDEFSKTLILEVENECAETDPTMGDAAAMVYVGDIYALRVCHGEEVTREEGDDESSRENGISPFIR